MRRLLSWSASLGLIGLLTACGSSAARAPHSSAPTAASAAPPAFVHTDISALWADRSQLLADAKTGNWTLVQQDLDTATRDWQQAQADLRQAPATPALRNSGFADFLTHYGRFLDALRQAVQTGQSGNLAGEQQALASATQVDAYLQTAFAVMTSR